MRRCAGCAGSASSCSSSPWWRWPGSRRASALQTAVLLPNLLDAGPKPLNLFSEAPQRSAVEYRPGVDGGDPELAELWLPSWASADRPAGAMLLVLGVNNVGRNHPVVARVAEGLARTGVAVLVPDSRVLLEGRLEAGEVDGVVRAFELLADRPEVDPERVGIVGFSVGGSLALLAAADPRIASDVQWVNAFGAFADASTYLASVASHAHRGSDGEEVPWTPSPLAREIYLRFMLDQVPDEADRLLLEAALADAVLAADRAPRTRSCAPRSRPMPPVPSTTSSPPRRSPRREAVIGSLPEGAQGFIGAISPLQHLDGLAADVHLMHETEDHHVPFTESRALASALESAGLLRAHTEFRLFDHVQPDDVDLVAAAPELVKLLLHVRALMEETL